MKYALNEEDDCVNTDAGAEHELWCQVIVQALADLNGQGKSDGVPTANDAYRAAVWFKGNGKDFREVCSLAGVDSDAVRKKAMEIIEERHLIPERAPMVRRILPESVKAKKPEAKPKRPRRLIMWNGESHTITDWSRKTGIDRRVLWSRLHDGWTAKRALTVPVDVERSTRSRLAAGAKSVTND